MTFYATDMKIASGLLHSEANTSSEYKLTYDPLISSVAY